MRFIDEAKLHVSSGKGGDGCASFRRERFVPFGGPDGGDGGRGGSVVLIATDNRTTLRHLRGRPIWKAKPGHQGGPNKCTGRSSEDIEIPIPVGTRIFDASSGEILVDITEDGQQWVACTGGRGGLGNVHFKTSTNRAPRKTTFGKPAEEKRLRLELMLMADVGLLGYPNAGKSTLISCMSGAHPKIASYPFTTLAPSLGVVDIGFEGSFVMADIPGLIEGAADGHGLGHQFLRHVRRSRVLLHMLSVCPDEPVSVLERYRIIRKELNRFDPELSLRPELITLTKCDLIDRETRKKLKADFLEQYPESKLFSISSIEKKGLEHLKYALWNCILKSKQIEQ
jgi:GTP-binding protein